MKREGLHVSLSGEAVTISIELLMSFKLGPVAEKQVPRKEKRITEARKSLLTPAAAIGKY